MPYDYGNIKAVSVHAMKFMSKQTSISTSPLDGDERSASRHRHFAPDIARK